MKTENHIAELTKTADEDLADIASFFDRHGDLWIDAYADSEESWYEYHPIRMRGQYAAAMFANEPKGTAVDLGCGAGHGLVAMRKLGFDRVIGVDISDRMVDSARRLVQSEGLEDCAQVYQGDVTNLDMIESASVDVCTALGVIEYLRGDETLLSEVHRILRPNGSAVIQVRNRSCIRSRTVELGKRLIPYFRSKIWYREHGLSEFRKIIETSGFRIEREMFCHFYALYPLDIIPGLRNLISPIDNFLSKKLERYSMSPGAARFASMYIPKLRKTGTN